jgi:hypothetical protein
MPFPKPLTALLAALVAGCSAPAQKSVAESPPGPCGAIVDFTDPEGIWEVELGKHRFCLPNRLFNGAYGPWGKGDDVGFVLDWPSLTPLPFRFDMYKDNNRFLTTLRIRMTYPSRLTDEQIRTFPRSWIEPFDPTNPEQRANPAENLDLRIKGDPVHGLVPYYTDFKALKHYYQKLYGPDTRAGEPQSSMSTDWFIDMGDGGIPRTVLKCSPSVIRDGVRMEGGRMFELRDVFFRATCDHYFALPEYQATVHLSYQRIVMSDWRRIEDRIRTLFREAEIDR